MAQRHTHIRQPLRSDGRDQNATQPVGSHAAADEKGAGPALCVL